MDRKNQRKDKERRNKRGKLTEGDLSDFSAFDAVKAIAVHNARNIDTDNEILTFLRSWWSKTYNRPLKDPLLQEYTIYELFYEYHDKKERALAIEEDFEYITDKIEASEEKETLDWVEEEERKEREEAEATALAIEEEKEADEQWMLQKLKDEHGDDFGDDLNLDFDR